MTKTNTKRKTTKALARNDFYLFNISLFFRAVFNSPALLFVVPMVQHAPLIIIIIIKKLGPVILTCSTPAAKYFF